MKVGRLAGVSIPHIFAMICHLDCSTDDIFSFSLRLPLPDTEQTLAIILLSSIYVYFRMVFDLQAKRQD